MIGQANSLAVFGNSALSSGGINGANNAFASTRTMHNQLTLENALSLEDIATKSSLGKFGYLGVDPIDCDIGSGLNLVCDPKAPAPAPAPPPPPPAPPPAPTTATTTTIVNENGSSTTSGSATSSTGTTTYKSTTTPHPDGTSSTTGSATSSKGTTTYTSTTTPNSDGSSSTSTKITSPQGQITTLESTSTSGPIPTTIATLTPPGTTYKATSTPDGIGMLSTTTSPNTPSETNIYNGTNSSDKDIAITAALAEASKDDNSLAIGLGVGLGLTALGAIAFFAIKNTKTAVHINDTGALKNEFDKALIEYKEKYENTDYAEKQKLANAVAEAGLKYGDAGGGGIMINVSQATYDAFKDAKDKSDADKDNNTKSQEKHTSAEVFAKEVINNNRRFLEEDVVTTIAGGNFGSHQSNDDMPPVVEQPASKILAPVAKNTLYALERGRK